MDEQLLVRLVADATQYNRVLASAEHSIVSLAGRIGAFSGLVQGTMTIAADAVMRVVNAFGRGASAAIRLAANYEEAAVAMRIMVGDAGRANDLMEELNQLAINSPFQSAGLLETSRMLKGYGVATGELTNTIKVLGDISAITGRGQDGLKHLAWAFGEVKSQGVLTGGMLNMFKNSGIPIMEALSKSMNKPIPMIHMMVEEGKVGIPQLEEALNSMARAGGFAAGGMDKLSATTKGQWNALNETIEVGMRDVGQAFLEGFDVPGLLKEITAFAAGLRDGVKDMKPFFGQMREGFDYVVKLAKGVRDWVKANEEVIVKVLAVVGILIAMKVAFIAMGIAIPIVIGLLTAFLSLCAALVVAVALVSTGLGSVILLIGSIGKELALAVWDTWGDDATNAANTVGRAFTDLGTQLTDIFGKTFEGVKAAMSMGDMKKVGEVMGKGLEVAFVATIAALKGLWVDFKEWMGKTFYDFVAVMLKSMIDFQTAVLVKPLELTGQTALATAVKNTAHDLTVGLGGWRADQEARISGVSKAEKGALQDPVRKAAQELDDLVKSVVAASDALDEYKQYLKQYAVADAGAYKVQNSMLATIPSAMLKAMTESEHRAFGFAAKIAANPGNPMAAFQAAAGPMSREQFTYKPPTTAAAADENQIGRSFAISPEAKKMAENIYKEMEAGTGPLAKHLDIFNRNIGRLKEANEGPFVKGAGIFGGIVGAAGVGGLATDEMHDYGRIQQYQQLEKSLNLQPFKQPDAVYQGTAQAQDAINAAQLREKHRLDPQLQMLAVLQAAAEQQKEAQRYRAQMVVALDKIAEMSKPVILAGFGGDIGGGGDF